MRPGNTGRSLERGLPRGPGHPALHGRTQIAGRHPLTHADRDGIALAAQDARRRLADGLKASRKERPLAGGPQLAGHLALRVQTLFNEAEDVRMDDRVALHAGDFGDA